uniref:interleukin-2 receptor subunit beta n=1 Tax=Centroberyx gerrardi TaxID=166262 RepID=UPI003AACEDA9
MVAVTMATLWSIYLVVLFSVHPAHSHRSLQGLSCLNDFVNNVSCTWSSSQVDPAVDCWIFGQKKAWTGLIEQGCKLKQLGSSFQGCSVVFENKKFSCSEVMPRIHVECNGTMVENLTNYKPCNHIKMHPPSVANVSASANQTWISWSPGSPHSYFFTSFEFQVQFKQNHQKWKEATTLSTEKQEIRIASGRKAGLYQVRVRVRPPDSYHSTHWSDWSPTASWERASAPEDQVPLLDRTSWFMLGGISLSTLLIGILLVLLRGCSNRGLLKGKPVPNPSEYFHTLHSVHGGDIKKWLNPQSASGSFFTAQPRDQISPVQVFDAWDAVPSTSPSSSSTSALLHFHPGRCPSADSDAGGSVMHRSASSASSGFSNLGYFYSSCPGSDPLRIDASPVYFTYQDDFRNPHLHLSLCPALAGSLPYECLRRPGGERKSEPQSPDSGFGIGMEDEAGEGEGRDADVDGDRHGSPLLILPLHLPSRMCPPSFPPPPSPSSSPPPPSHPPSPPQVQPDNQGLEVPAAAPSGSYVAWPAGGAMCRSSSMPVEPCKTGYLTLKELQTTYSNKSI